MTIPEAHHGEDPRPGPRRMLPSVIIALVILIVGLVLVHTVVNTIILAYLSLTLGIALLAMFVGPDALVILIVAVAGGSGQALDRYRIARTPVLLSVAAVMLWGVAWHLWLGPMPRSRAIVDDVAAALETRRAAGETLPDVDALVTGLDINGADPHGLRHAFDPARGVLVDGYGTPLRYERGIRNTYAVTSAGADGWFSGDAGMSPDDYRVGDSHVIAIEAPDLGGLAGAVLDHLKGDAKDADADPGP